MSAVLREHSSLYLLRELCKAQHSPGEGLHGTGLPLTLLRGGGSCSGTAASTALRALFLV